MPREPWRDNPQYLGLWRSARSQGDERGGWHVLADWLEENGHPFEAWAARLHGLTGKEARIDPDEGTVRVGEIPMGEGAWRALTEAPPPVDALTVFDRDVYAYQYVRRYRGRCGWSLGQCDWSSRTERDRLLAIPRLEMLGCELAGPRDWDWIIDNLPGLMHFEAVSAQIDNEEIVSLTRLSRLTSLKLLGNATAHTRYIASLPNLRHLSLNCDLFTYEAKRLGELAPNVESLHADPDNIGDEVHWSHLRSLRMGQYADAYNSPRLGDRELRALARHVRLERLDVQCGNVTADGITALAELPALRELTLRSTVPQSRVQRRPAPPLKGLARAAALEALTIEGEIDADRVREIVALGRLRTLSLGKVSAGTSLVALAGLPRLEQVRLHGDGTAAGDLTGLAALPHLEKLDLKELSLHSETAARVRAACPPWVECLVAEPENSAMRAVDLIRKKRDGHALSAPEIAVFVRAATDDTWPDYQLAALLMAIVCRGMNADETSALTGAMVDSGVRLRLDDVPGVKVDKHSTGGVGDKTSLILAPLAAACGVIVPMMSGRGLGHTGGTLDKLESIPGFNVRLPLDEFRAALRDIGCCMIGQTAEIAPADRKLYALRDVTGTVESIPLISASIMSKKLAEGIDALVLDVKCGHGAFMKNLPDARKLAQSLQRIGHSQGLKTEVVLTAMDAPLGRVAGNALEVIESIEVLKGKGPADLEGLSVHLAARMVRLAGLAASLEDAETKVRAALTSGRGLDKFRAIIERHGGDPHVIDDYKRLPTAAHVEMLRAPRPGHVSGIHAERIGLGTMILGAGRERAEQHVDHAVGVLLRCAVGDEIKSGDTLLEIHYNDPHRLRNAVPLFEQAFEFGDNPPPQTPLILDTLEAVHGD